MAVTQLVTEQAAEFLIFHSGCKQRTHVQLGSDRLYLNNDKCPHRGGPLHLGKRKNNGFSICPWHGTAVIKPREAKHVAAVRVVSKCLLTLIIRDTTTNGRGPIIKKLTPQQRECL